MQAPLWCPQEIWKMIIEYLLVEGSMRTLSSFSLVCRSFREWLFQLDGYWKIIVCERFGVSTKNRIENIYCGVPLKDKDTINLHEVKDSEIFPALTWRHLYDRWMSLPKQSFEFLGTLRSQNELFLDETRGYLGTQSRDVMEGMLPIGERKESQKMGQLTLHQIVSGNIKQLETFLYFQNHGPSVHVFIPEMSGASSCSFEQKKQQAMLAQYVALYNSFILLDPSGCLIKSIQLKPFHELVFQNLYFSPDGSLLWTFWRQESHSGVICLFSCPDLKLIDQLFVEQVPNMDSCSLSIHPQLPHLAALTGQKWKKEDVIRVKILLLLEEEKRKLCLIRDFETRYFQWMNESASWVYQSQFARDSWVVESLSSTSPYISWTSSRHTVTKKRLLIPFEEEPIKQTGGLLPTINAGAIIPQVVSSGHLILHLVDFARSKSDQNNNNNNSPSSYPNPDITSLRVKSSFWPVVPVVVDNQGLVILKSGDFDFLLLRVIKRK